MTFKRNIDRLPIPPKDAKVQTVVCQFCIVGCGYHAISWPVDRQGGPRPAENVFGVDLSEQQGPNTPNWFAPSMYNIVQQNGRDVHLVLKPDEKCSVNSGLGSTRGARMGELSYSATNGTSPERLTDPLVWRYGQLSPTSWDDAIGLVAEVTRRVIEAQGEDGLIVSAYDHGGAGGGYENTWATGKLYFASMKIKNIRIHNRPAYNSEVHGTRDMGVPELNNCYEDAELADTIVAVGTNALETQTNYFLNHWVPNLRGTSVDKKRAEFGAAEPAAPGRIIVVDPRRTTTIAACEAEAGKANVLHLAIKSGTDLALFNALFTEIAAKGWVDRGFIAASTNGFDAAVSANHTTVEQAAEITGLAPDDIRRAAAWIAEPKSGGARRRTMFAYEKGLIWGNDNYRTNQALVNIALATGNLGRPGGGCVRMGGHQEGYVRPPEPTPRPAVYVDQLLIGGGGRRAPHLGLRPFQDHAERERVQARLQAAHRSGEGRDRRRAGGRPRGDGRGDHGRDPPGRPVLGGRRHRADPDRHLRACHAAGGHVGRGEPDEHERRAAHAPDRALHGPARPQPARQPDRGEARAGAGSELARRRQARTSPTSSKAMTGRPRKTRSWTAITRTRTAARS